MNSPIAPRVFSSLRDPKAMDGRRQAKYRKIMVVMYFPIALLFPIIPVTNHNKITENLLTSGIGTTTSS